MEILQFLLYFLLSEYGGEELSPLLENYKQLNFDVYKFLKSLTIKDFLPILKIITKGNEKKRPEKERFSNLKPIIKIANNDILENMENFLSK